MDKIFFFIVFFFIGLIVTQQVKGQNEYENLLFEEVEVENPVYMPVIGVGVGIMNFFGEVHDDYSYFLNGLPAYRVNVSTFIDKKHFLKGNFFLINGKLTGNERTFSELPADTLNFQSVIFDYGLNLEYGFGNFFKGPRKVRPYISIGIGFMQFNSKGDIEDATGEPYIYSPDGTIRNANGNIISRDFKYETDLRKADYYGAGVYEQSAFTIPAELGFDFSLSDRATFRFGSSFNYTFTDYLDNISYKNKTGVIGDSQNDFFTFTYAAFSLDLFSEAKSYTIEKYFAEVETDYASIEDEDYDQVLDFGDDCPNTPLGVDVDSVGCPFDDDGDGVPNYIDDELNTPRGVFVNEKGAALSDDEIIASLGNMDAVDRKDAYIYPVTLGWSKYSGMSNLEIPEKYKKLDIDKDDYISFDELLKAIDDFFDMKSTFTTEDIYDINDFFFAQ